MPIFEYQCRKCDEVFEELVRADTVVACPSCGSRSVEKKLSRFAAHAAGEAGAPPPCYSGQCGCDLGKCGSGRCGVE